MKVNIGWMIRNFYQSHVLYSQAVNMFKALSDKMQNLMLVTMLFPDSDMTDMNAPKIAIPHGMMENVQFLADIIIQTTGGCLAALESDIQVDLLLYF